LRDHHDPYLLTKCWRVSKDPKDIEYTKAELIKAFDSYKLAPVAADKLNAVKSNLKYGFALVWIARSYRAANLAPYIAPRRTPETLNKLYDLCFDHASRTFSRWLRSILSRPMSADGRSRLGETECREQVGWR